MSAQRAWAGWVMGSAIAAISVACVKTDTEVTVAAANAHPHAAEVWAAKCSSCHVRVDPGTRQRSTIDAALARHRTRAKLTENEWAELADFLAPTGPVAMGTRADEDLGQAH